MQYRHERGQSEPAGTYRKQAKAKLEVSTAAKAKLAGACPIPYLYCIGASLINEHSPSLRRSEYSGSVPQIQTYYTLELVSSMVTVPRFEESEASGSVPDSMSILHWSERLQ